MPDQTGVRWVTTCCAALIAGAAWANPKLDETLPYDAQTILTAETNKAKTDAVLQGTADYMILDQPVVAFLNMLAQDRGLRLDLSDRVRGRIGRTRLTGSVGDILDRLSNMQGLDWFVFNGVIHVSARDEAMTRLIRLGDLTSSEAIDILDKADLKLDRYPIRATAEQSTIAISGPPRMLALAEAVIESVPVKTVSLPPAPKPPQGRKVLVRRGTEIEVTNIPVAD